MSDVHITKNPIVSNQPFTAPHLYFLSPERKMTSGWLFTIHSHISCVFSDTEFEFPKSNQINEETNTFYYVN